MYHPDKWVVFKIINNDEVFYKVFGMWCGGYTGSHSWRLNSGVTKVEEEGNCYLFHGSSGSTYKVHKDSYGLTNYGANITTSFMSSGKVTVMPEDTNWLELEYG